MTGLRRQTGTGGLLAVHAHPDDETLTHGATLAAWAQAGQPVTLVTCTRGERGEVIPPELKHLEGDGPALARVREEELAHAAQALGLSAHYFLDQLPLIEDDAAHPGSQPVREIQTRYEDSGMVWLDHGAAGAGTVAPSSLIAADIEVAAKRLAHLIRTTRPQFLLTYEPGGGYGHPDHVRAREIAVRAAHIAADAGFDGDPWKVPAILGSVVPVAVMREARDELARRHAHGLIPEANHLRPETSGEGLAALVREDTRNIISLSADAQALAAREAALRAHRTQVQAVHSFEPQYKAPFLSGGFGLSNGFYSPLLSRDFYEPAPDWKSVPLTDAALIPHAVDSGT